MNIKLIPMHACGLRLIASATILLLAACSNSKGGGSSSTGDEGTESTPVTLTVGTPHDGSISKLGTSYYRFATTASSAYRISLTNTSSDLSWTLYSNSDFTVTLKDCDNSFEKGDEVCTSGSALTAGTTYYLSVDEDDLVAGTYKLLVETSATLRALHDISFEAEGQWSLCKFDNAVGHDVDDVLTITGMALARTEVYLSSIDGSCSGNRTPVSALTYTLTDTGTAILNAWTNGTDTTAAPVSADGSTRVVVPTATRLLATSLTGAQEKWLGWVDDTVPTQTRLYLSIVTPSIACAASKDGFPQCLISTYYYTKQ